MTDHGLDDLIQKYSQEDNEPWAGMMVGVSTKISRIAKIKLEAIAEHVGVKKTPLLGEIAEAAINDMFDRMYDEMEENIKQGVAHELGEF